ncbi:hypothetical protein [Pseudothermotoga lettingae]|jgi:hypothetical protein|uniref:Uncharacterized protein n=2 Tax=Thermotogaceae TaxID=188709 RepID=A8F6Y2_PSELT|nr:hypothetical protein [Pseudothermotoga lettingae]ABV33916.1 hypothetical protein Tlet_1359 [Pseudothermotoga lettingae TMO]KUK21937.1 MAG: Uncharacterized protein XD56_0124 [Pseudothermotoga lettingae]MDK2884252.1 hypothetical protein [Pseudothermotoga sp.]
MMKFVVYVLVSTVFLISSMIIIDSTMNHAKAVCEEIENDIDFFMTVDFLRIDFWSKSVSSAAVMENKLAFEEIVDDKMKVVNYLVQYDREEKLYNLKRVAHDGVNVVYRSQTPIYFKRSSDDVWTLCIEKFEFDMIASTPSELRGSYRIPYMLNPKLLYVREK